ncbi:MAG: hypothetical protein KAK00_00700 [Nanoarchaeota archaeon]|nr:hypothetical protein [Nanoarchaeota archaeon]
MRYAKYLSSDKTLLIVLPRQKQDMSFLQFLKNISEHHTALYVSLSKTYGSLAEKFIKNNIVLNKFFIIDSISGILKLPGKEHKNCSYFALPNTLPNLKKEIEKQMKIFSPDYLLFDSLSNLISFREILKGECSDFLLNIKKITNKKQIFLCNQGDEKTFKYIFDKNKINIDVLHWQ